MKSLTQYIVESLITEGGKAVEGTPMTQSQCKAVYNDVAEKFLSKLGLDKDGTTYAALGSFGKKHEDQTSGDIDIAISIETVAGYLGIPTTEVEQYICDLCEKENITYKYGKGIHVISIAWPIPGTDNYGQVDLMPTDNMEYSKWMYHSPDFTKAESKYKGLYRNQLIMKIIKNVDQKVLSKNDKDEVMEYERYALRMNSGIARTVRSHIGKRGRLKNPIAIKELEKHITNVPEDIIKLAFGEGINKKDTMTFESCYKMFMNKKFPWANEREKIMEEFIDEIIKTKVPIPEEVYNDWKDIVDKFRKENNI